MVRGLDGFCGHSAVRVWRCAVLKGLRRCLSTLSGGFGEGETPLPIPNREVKPLSADGTWLERARESRSPPVCLISRAAPPGRLVVVGAGATLAARGAAPLAQAGGIGSLAPRHGVTDRHRHRPRRRRDATRREDASD